MARVLAFLVAVIAGTGAIVATASGATSAMPAGDATRGAKIYEDNCTGCHSLDANRIGPAHRGVFGRKAGDRPRYNYSNAMRTADFTWDAEKLDHWLENPRTFLPGNKMTFPGLPDATDRRDVIAFLKVETGYKPEPAPAA